MQRHQTVYPQCGRGTEGGPSTPKNWDSKRPVPPSLAKTRSLKEAELKQDEIIS